MATLTEAAINDLPDEDFAYVEPGGSLDESGRTVPRSLRHFPIHDRAHVENALARAPQSPFGDKAMPKIVKAAKKMGIGDYGNDGENQSRSDQPVTDIMRYDRSWALDDVYIQRSGDGRTVEAYAAVFDSPSEIKDQHGHYMETIHRSAFNRAISHGINRINVFYNHGFTIHGNADALTSVPIGSPVDIRPDGRGLRTVTRFNRSTLADSVLEAIKAGDIRGYSFRGRIFQSDPARVPRPRPGTALPTITRTVLGLAEYGPTPTPAYADAGIVAVRSAREIAADIDSLDDDERAELIRMFNPQQAPDTATAPVVGLGPEDSPDERSGHQARFQQFREELRKRGVLK